MNILIFAMTLVLLIFDIALVVVLIGLCRGENDDRYYR